MVSMFSDLRYANSPEELKSFGEIPYKCYWANRKYPIKELLEEGRIPLSTAGLMERRLEVMDKSYDYNIRNFWWETSFKTPDGLFHRPAEGNEYRRDEDIKIVRHSKSIILQEIYSHNWLFDTEDWFKALEEGEKIYRSLEGTEIKSNEVYNLINKSLINNGKLDKTALSNKVILALSDNDPSLLEKYLKAVEEIHPPIYDEDNFEFNLRMSDFAVLVENRSGYQGFNAPIGRSWKLGSMRMWRSAFYGGYVECGDFLVGILPEKADKYNNRDASQETIEKIKSFSDLF
jgi:hypothetical protein